MTRAFQLRHKDYSLSDEQVALRDSFTAFFDKWVDSQRIRAAEPLGTAIYGGSTEIACNVIAERYLGLPRSTPRRSMDD